MSNSTLSNANGPVLSVLIPTYRDDPRPLIWALHAEILEHALGDAVEIVVFDDGSGDDALAQNIANALAGGPAPGHLVRAPENVGRAAARNRLAHTARGAWALYLDADMAPSSPVFLTQWLAIAEDADADAASASVIFGGFQVPDVAADTEAGRADHTPSLHQALAERGDTASVAERRMSPVRHVFTSNLLARTNILRICPFDEGFSGWGWEDVEWARRASALTSIAHADNPAAHGGWVDDTTVLNRFRASAENFARLVRAHPDFARELPLWRAARVFAGAPVLNLLRPAFAAAARAYRWPPRLRTLGAKLWRASWYGEALG